MLSRNLIEDIKYVFKLANKKNFLFIQLIIIITALIELTSLVSIIPFITLVLSPESIFENNLLNFIYLKFKFQNTDQFLIYCGLTTLFLFISSTIFIIVTKYNIIKFNQNLLVSYGSYFYKKFLEMDYSFYLSESSNKIVLNLHDDLTRLTQGFIQPLMNLISRLILISFITIALLFYKPIITIILISILAIAYFFIFFFFKSIVADNGRKLTNLTTIKYKLINESFNSIKDIIISKKQEFFSKYYIKIIRRISKLYLFQNIVSHFPRYLIDAICFGFIIILIIFFKIFHNNELDLILSTITFIAFSAYKLIPAFQEIYSSLIIMKNNRNVLSNIKIMFEKDNIKIKKLKKPPQIKKIILIKNLKFTYPSRPNINIFHKSNISIYINKSHVITGSTGSGKTTLMEILLGLHSFSADQILFDKKPINFENYNLIKNLISYVPQNSILVDESILSNICFAENLSYINKNNLNLALKVSELTSFIESLPSGLETNIGDKGVKLSGGQKQRISIARAIYQNKPFLFLDESMSALDLDTENKVLKSILELKKTVILITHRKNILDRFDYKYHIKSGLIK